MEEEPVEPVQMNIYQVNTYGKNLSWATFWWWAKGLGLGTQPHYKAPSDL